MTSLLHPIHLTLFQRARERIEDPTHWTQWAFARTAEGIDCSSHSPDACRWCVRGAVARTSTELRLNTSVRECIYWSDTVRLSPAGSFDEFINSLAEQYQWDIWNYPQAYRDWTRAAKINDEGTHKIVMELLDNIIRQIKLDLAKQI